MFLQNGCLHGRSKEEAQRQKEKRGDQGNLSKRKPCPLSKQGKCNKIGGNPEVANRSKVQKNDNKRTADNLPYRIESGPLFKDVGAKVPVEHGRRIIKSPQGAESFRNR